MEENAAGDLSLSLPARFKLIEEMFKNFRKAQKNV